MINGFQNEQIFISNINGRPYKIQNLLLQDLLKELFPKIKDEDIVYAYKYGKYAKTDMVLEVNGKRKGISIKKGIKNSVHLEHVNKFLNRYWYLPRRFKNEFLKYLEIEELSLDFDNKNAISEKMIDALSMYYIGDNFVQSS